jgi:hypothetical protein
MWRLERALRRLGRISATERRILAEAFGLLPVVHGLQQLLPFKRWRELLEKGAPTRSPRASAPTVSQIAWAVEVARRWLPGEYKCLPAAYTTHLLLYRHGYVSDVHVGVSRDAQGKVEAHAWVDCEGRTVIGLVENMERFVPFPPLRAAAARSACE